jgi:hypothetical protein
MEGLSSASTDVSSDLSSGATAVEAATRVEESVADSTEGPARDLKPHASAQAIVVKQRSKLAALHRFNTSRKLAQWSPLSAPDHTPFDGFNLVKSVTLVVFVPTVGAITFGAPLNVPSPRWEESQWGWIFNWLVHSMLTTSMAVRLRRAVRQWEALNPPPFD